MKKISLFVLLSAVACIAFGQTKNLKTADRNYKSAKFDKALEAIELAIVEPENAVLPEAWFSRAKIYTAVSTHAELSKLHPQATSIALEAFTKAFELETSNKLKLLGQMEVIRLANAAYDEGATFYGEKKFAEASSAFKISVAANQLVDIIDTNALFNVALCADFGGEKAVAKEFYLRLIELKADQPSAYTSLANIYKSENNKEEALKYADLAVVNFPEDYNAIINAASIHLMLSSSTKAQEILSMAATKWADNELVFFALGVAYDQMGLGDEAEKSYLKALEIKADYFDAIFNLGAYYVSAGVKVKAEADALPLSETAKYDEMSEKANNLFRKAVPSLEKALSMKPGEVNVMHTLKELYVHLRMMDKASSISAEIEKIEGAK